MSTIASGNRVQKHSWTTVSYSCFIREGVETVRWGCPRFEWDADEAVLESHDKADCSHVYDVLLQSVNSVSVKFTLIFHPGDMTSFMQMDLLSSSSSDSSTFSYLWLETNSHNWGRLSKITSFSVSFKAAQVKLQFKSPQLNRIHFFTFAATWSHKLCFQLWLIHNKT